MNPDQSKQSDWGPYCLQYTVLKNISRREEQTTKVVTVCWYFLQVQINRMKEQQDRLTEDKEKYDTAKQQAEEKVKQVQRQLRDLREEFSDVQKKEMEIESKYKENVSSLEPIENTVDSR